MDVVQITDGRESVYARAAQGGVFWRITWDTGLSVDTGASLSNEDGRPTLHVYDLPTLRRVSASFAPSEKPSAEHRHEQGQKGAAHASSIRRAGRAQKSGGRR